jgi:hypothetical protein
MWNGVCNLRCGNPDSTYADANAYPNANSDAYTDAAYPSAHATATNADTLVGCCGSRWCAPVAYSS